ncbi:MAG: metallophosphoesterase [Clostridia bacterium]
MTKFKLLVWLFFAMLVLYLGINVIGKSRLAVRTYNLTSEKLKSPVVIVLLTDLHACLYGQKQSDLISLVDAQCPDLVLFGGDMINHSGSYENTLTLISALAAKYPCYYVTGNHEIATRQVSKIKQQLLQANVTVLAGKTVTVTVCGQQLQLSGIDDFFYQHRIYILPAQLRSASTNLDDALFSVLLAHRPDKYKWYLPYGYDLILCGHAHGGQVRIPGLLNGLYAPNQGLFPRYAGGEYSFDDQTMIVSRGLSKKPYWMPRVFNPPELVVINLLPQQSTAIQ